MIHDAQNIDINKLLKSQYINIKIKYISRVYTNKLNCLFTRITVTFIICVSYYTSLVMAFLLVEHMSSHSIRAHVEINESKYRYPSIN